MTRRRGLIVAAVASLAIFGVLLVLDGRMMDAGGPGIVGFEVAGSQDRATEILGEWGGQGIDAARASLWIDYAYIAAYTTFLFLAAVATRELAEARGWRRMAAFGAVAPWLAVAGGAFDAVEDAGLLLALDGNGGAFAPRLAQICASLKFALLAVTTVYLLAGLLLRFRARPA
jgi:hypothetical protein